MVYRSARMLHTHYDNLGISRSADSAQIKAAYRKLASAYHPDRNPEREDDAHHWMAIINEAYAVLSDPERRREYDKWIAMTELTQAQHEAASQTAQDDRDAAGAVTATTLPHSVSYRTMSDRAAPGGVGLSDRVRARRKRRAIGTILWAACVWAGLSVADMIGSLPSTPRAAGESQWSVQHSEYEAAKRTTKADCDAGYSRGNSEECYIASRCAAANPVSYTDFETCRQQALRVADVIALQVICETPDSTSLEAMCDVSRTCFKSHGGSRSAYSACTAGVRSTR